MPRPPTFRLAPQRSLLSSLLILGTLCSPLIAAGAQSAAPPAPPSPAIPVQPGDFLTVPVPLPAGAPASEYTVSATLPDGWTLLTETITPADGQVLLSVFVPDNARAGQQQLAFTLRPSAPELSALQVPVTVSVPARADFRVEFPDQARVRPNEQRTFSALITNTGNGPDTLHLKVEGSARLSTDHLTLQPGQTGRVDVIYTHTSQGNADAIVLSASSSVDPQRQQQELLAVQVGQGRAPGGAPQLSWAVTATPTVSREPGRAAPATPATPGQVPTLPGLPGTQVGADSPVTEEAGGPAINWKGTLSASVGGALSDYASGSASYSAQRNDQGQLTDTAALLVDWGAFSVSAMQQDRLGRLNFGVRYTGGAFQYEGRAFRTLSSSADPTYGVGLGLRHDSGVYFAVTQTLGGLQATEFGVGFKRRFGALTPDVQVSAVLRDGQWGYALNEQLNYENRLLLAQQRYTFDSLQSAHRLDVQVSSRQAEPVGLSGAVHVTRVSDVTTYGLSGTVTYHPTPNLTGKATLGYDRKGFSVQAEVVRTLNLGANSVYLSGLSAYREGTLSGLGQVTGVLPSRNGQFVVTGLLGYDGGLVYGGGLGYSGGAFSVAGGAQAGPQRLNLTASARYLPARGVQATADYAYRRQPDPLSTVTTTTQSAYATLGYAADRWSAAVIAGAVKTDDQNWTPLYGAQVGARVMQAVQVQGRVEQLSGRTRFTLGAQITPGGAFNTPGAIVNLFGGRNAGTVKLQAFLDENRNGVQDAGEGPLASTFALGNQEVQTDAQGQASLLLKPGQYRLELGGEVLAQYLVQNLPPVEVKLKQTVTVTVPVQQVGRLRGQLTDESGNPLAGLTVQVSGPEGTYAATTDAAGLYQLTGLRLGTYSVMPQVNPALYQVAEAQSVTLSAAQALQTLDVQLTSVQENRTLDTQTLPLELTLPEDALPPGARIPVRVRVAEAAQQVRVEGLNIDLLPTTPARDVWEGVLTVPRDQQLPLEIVVTATQGDRSGSVSGLLMVDPAIKAEALMLSPYHALPGQTLVLRAQIYSQASTVLLRDEQGNTVVMKRVSDNEFTATVAASQVVGKHTLSLVIDGTVRAEAVYNVLGR